MSDQPKMSGGWGQWSGTQRFAVGQRVVVAYPIVALMVGHRYWGHVTEVTLPGADNPFRQPLYWVALKDTPDQRSVVHDVLVASPMPFFEPELDVID